MFVGTVHQPRCERTQKCRFFTVLLQKIGVLFQRVAACLWASGAARTWRRGNRRQRCVGDAEKLRACPERLEGLKISAGHPGLQPQADDFVEQRGAAGGIQVGGNLVEQQDRTDAIAPLAREFGVGEDEADQQRFLLTR